MIKMFQNKLSMRIVSIFVAVILWFVFLNDENPYTEKVLTIPIKVINEETLAEKGYFLKSDYIDNVEIIIKGREKTLDKISAQNFNLVTDFSQVKKSGNETIFLGLPDYDVKGIKIASIEPSIMKLEIGVQGNKELNVDLVFEGKVADRYKILEVTQVPDTILIDGEKQEVSLVAKAKAFINIDGLKSSFSTKKEVFVYDINDNEIVKFRNRYIVDTRIIIGKEVSLTPNIKGIPNIDFYIESLEINPITIFITGEADTLETISSLQSTLIDVSDLSKNKVYDIAPILPVGIKAAEGYSFGTLNITLGNIVTKTISINSQDVLLSMSRPDDFEYIITPELIDVNIRGKEKDLEFFTGKDLNARLNVADLDASPQDPVLLIIDSPINIEVLDVPEIMLEIKGK